MHFVIWATPIPKTGNAPAVNHSWLFGEQRMIAVTLAFVAGALLVVGGIALWTHAGWWRSTAIAGLAVSFGLMVLYFSPWFVPIETVNLALVIGLAWLDVPSRATLGA